MIRYWNRNNNTEEVEKVYGGSWIEFFYGNPLGRTLTHQVLSRRWLSALYGVYQNTRTSTRAIKPFLSTFDISIKDFEEKNYTSFNDFFIRKFRPGKRPFDSRPGQMPAFAEARYFGFEQADAASTFPVKGSALNTARLLDSVPEPGRFRGGPLLIARLCPVDYHRFHFPDAGTVSFHVRVPGRLHSVNPAALRAFPDVFETNERHITLLETEHFGTLAYIEVGALCVGRIVQSHSLTTPFARGEEKGYFLFGASTVIVLGQPGKWRPHADILEKTQAGIECWAPLGQAIAEGS